MISSKIVLIDIIHDQQEGVKHLDFYGKQAVETVAPGDILGRKNALRLGGVPDEAMDAARAQLTEQCGPPAIEDDRLAVFFLD